MASTELGLASRIGREMVVRKVLANVASNFDIALIDCPSTLSLLTVNALTAAQAVLVPAQADGTHVRGLWLFLAPRAPRPAPLPLLAVGPLGSTQAPEDETASYFPTDPQAQLQLAERVEKWIADSRT